ncbi:hypothetical protein BX591_104195 [Paraburkholderia bryophila]|uniref:Uncharacterized protein n=2 Tax=Paraburkholderia bryophila TaxID=420952 RepID=A0A329CYP7_9BURK|nr:hypothetical protein BX591_104195 [Paraburkholderia bryophila]
MPRNLPQANDVNPAEKLTAIVARGRTVFVGTSITKAWDHALNKEVDVVKPADPRGPGETVELPATEVERLIRLGFLVSPDDAAVPVQEGAPSTVKLLDRSEVGFAQKAI